MKGWLLAFTLACLPAWAHMGPHPEAGVAFDQHVGARVPIGLAFTDTQGKRETLREAISGKPALLLLGYVRCKDLCSVALPAMASALDQAGLAPGRDYRAIFASIDAREGPDVLARGADRIPPRDRAAWAFLGADDKSVHALAQTVGFHYRYEPEHDAFAHPEGIVVLAPDGRISRYLFGMRVEPADLRLALAEAALGRTGNIADRLLLLCYHFDPATGRYTPAVLDALRALIALCAVIALFFTWRMAWPRSRGGRAP